VARAADRLGLSTEAVARTIGVPEGTAARIRSGAEILEAGSKPYELALLLIRVDQSLGAALGGNDGSRRSWMEAENLAVGGVPRDLVQTVAGLVATLDHLEAAAAGHAAVALRPAPFGPPVTRTAQADPAVLPDLIDETLVVMRVRAMERAIGRIRCVLTAQTEEHVLRLDRIMAIANEVWGDAVKARDWLTRPHMLLGGHTPLGLAATEAGAAQVERILRNLQHGLPV
jgi:putative toxin-antitoxin system antitoxin component (TIGR02293 family)